MQPSMAEMIGWLHSTVGRTPVLEGKLTLSCARTPTDRWPLCG